MLAQQHSRCGRNPDQGARDAAPAGRRRLHLLRLHGLLRAEHHRVVQHAPGAELLADYPGQSAAGGVGDIVDPQQARIPLIAGTQGRNEGDPSP